MLLHYYKAYDKEIKNESVKNEQNKSMEFLESYFKKYPIIEKLLTLLFILILIGLILYCDKLKERSFLLTPMEGFSTIKDLNSKHVIMVLFIIFIFFITIFQAFVSFFKSLLIGIILCLITFLSLFYPYDGAYLDFIYKTQRVSFIFILILNLLRIFNLNLFIKLVGSFLSHYSY